MQAILPPVEKKILETELNKERFVRTSNNGSNEIYIICHNDSPNVMREIGRLREVTFREAGGGTGLEIDVDEHDIGEVQYKQLIVWNPEEKEIVGGYRFIRCGEALDSYKQIHLSTTHYFKFSEKFVNEYMPYTIELGRSWIQPKFQPSATNRKGLFSLDNLWDGLGALVVDNPDMKYFFGKVTMYKDFNQRARDMILYFMHYYFPDKEKLVVPHKPLGYYTNTSGFKALFEGLNYKDGHAVLNKHVRALGENIPPLINSYMNLSPTMKTFGTADNNDFGDVEETGIMVTIADIYPTKKDRHITTYVK